MRRVFFFYGNTPYKGRKNISTYLWLRCSVSISSVPVYVLPVEVRLSLCRQRRSNSHRHLEWTHVHIALIFDDSEACTCEPIRQKEQKVSCIAVRSM